MNPTLIIIFNHKFNGNIKKLYDMYSKRFSNIRFIVPFYEGDDTNVIGVYESSYQFQGYIAQARKVLEDIDCTHFVFIGDDLVLNPFINEENILQSLSISNNYEAYFGSYTPLVKSNFWRYQRFRDISIAMNSVAVNYKKEIPSVELATKCFEQYNGNTCYRLEGYLKTDEDHMGLSKKIKKSIKYFFDFDNLKKAMEYPMISGYSDFFVLPKVQLKRFAHLSGVFAAMRVFVEISIPTSLMLTIPREKLKTQDDIELLTENMWERSRFVEKFEEDCQYDLSKIKKFWPKEYMYLHPIKLSKWSDGK